MIDLPSDNGRCTDAVFHQLFVHNIHSLILWAAEQQQLIPVKKQNIKKWSYLDLLTTLDN